MKKIFFLSIIFALILPSLALGDGGMIWWPPPIELNQSAQNAIVAWNGTEGIILLSVDIESSDEATVLRVIPLPANPTEIKEGEFESFEILIEIMNEKLEIDRGYPLAPGFEGKGEEVLGIEITFHEQIGAHDITVVKVNDLDVFLGWIKDFSDEHGFEHREVSSQFREGVANYLKREINHFVFDVIDAGQEKESIKPILYQFETDCLYYPILISGISGISESQTEIDLFLITKKDIQFKNPPHSYYKSWEWFRNYGYPVLLSQEELEEVSEEIAGLFEDGARVRKASIYAKLKDLDRDLMLFPSSYWGRSFALGDKGEKVKALQKFLINEGLWQSRVGATGYFGPITKTALQRIQERYSQDILQPIGLTQGTGYFGPKTRNYLKQLSLSVESISPVPPVQPVQLRFIRNLYLGARGEDIKRLQERLIKEGVWQSSVSATGYFGPITRAAVIRYQEKYTSEILRPLGLGRGTGFVGPSTRVHLEK